MTSNGNGLELDSTRKRSAYLRFALAILSIVTSVIIVLATGSLHPKWLGLTTCVCYAPVMVLGRRSWDYVAFPIAVLSTLVSFCFGGTNVGLLSGAIGAVTGVAGLSISAFQLLIIAVG